MAQLAFLPCCGEAVERCFFSRAPPRGRTALCPACNAPLSRQLFAAPGLRPRAARGRSRGRPCGGRRGASGEPGSLCAPLGAARSPRGRSHEVGFSRQEAQHLQELPPGAAPTPKLQEALEAASRGDAACAEGVLNHVLAELVDRRVDQPEAATAADVAAGLLRRFPGEPGIQEAGHAVLRCQAELLAAAGGMEDAQALTLLMVVLRLTVAAAPTEAEAALRDLVTALESGDGPRERCSDKRRRVEHAAVCIAAEGGVDVVRAAMRAHPAIPGVQVAACQVLRDLVDSAPEDLQAQSLAAVAGDDGVDLVAMAMRAHPASQEVQAESALMLLSVACGSETLAALVARSGAAELALEALRRHEEAAEVQSAGCALLAQLAAGGSRAAVLAHGGATALAAAALRGHCGHAGTQQHGCELLANLSAGSATHAAEVAAVGARQLAAAAMRAHIGSQPIQQAAGRLLAGIAVGAVRCWAPTCRPGLLPPTGSLRTPERYDTDQAGRLLV